MGYKAAAAEIVTLADHSSQILTERPFEVPMSQVYNLPALVPSPRNTL